MSLDPLPPGAGDLLTEAAARIEHPFWVSAGTCLGLYRDGDLIADDTDIDIAMLWREGLDGELCSWLGWEEYGRLYTEGRLMQLVFSHRGVIFDIYFHYPYDDDNYYSEGVNGKTIIPRRMYDNLDCRETRYGVLPFPSDTEGYLEARYGDWQTPRPGDKPKFS